MSSTQYIIQLIWSYTLTILLTITCLGTRITQNDFNGATIKYETISQSCSTATNCMKDLCLLQNGTDANMHIVFHQNVCPHFPVNDLISYIDIFWFIVGTFLIVLELMFALLLYTYVMSHNMFIRDKIDQFEGINITSDLERNPVNVMDKRNLLIYVGYFVTRMAMYILISIIFSYGMNMGMIILLIIYGLDVLRNVVHFVGVYKSIKIDAIDIL